MSTETESELPNIEQRLARMETELRAARAQISDLAQWQTEHKQRKQRANRARSASLVGAIALAVGAFYLPSVLAKPSGKAAGGASGAKGLTIRGPLVVLDSAGKIVMRVQDKNASQSRGMVVFNAQGNAIIQATASPTTGHGTLLARNGLASVGPGAGFIFDKTGNAVLSMEGANDKAFVNLSSKGFQLMNDSEAVVLNLGYDQFGGLMNLCNNDGKSVVEAGSVSANRGLVRVYPSGKQIPVPIPTFIMGSKTK